MKLYLVRHAHAVSDAEDPARPLSPKGRAAAQDMARWVRQHAGPQVEEIWHSPLVRARETAELFAEGLKLQARLREVPGLLPEDPPASLATALARHGDSVMIVGHEPHLSTLAGLLLGATAGEVEFKKGAVLCIERVLRGGPWTLLWLVSPSLVAGED
jgi:phosphohistidine phosphatase